MFLRERNSSPIAVFLSFYLRSINAIVALSHCTRFNSQTDMASTAPAKSQPLHNFALPHLKWNKNDSNNQQRRRSSTSKISSSYSGGSSSPLRHDSPKRESLSQSPMVEPPVVNSPVRESPRRDRGNQGFESDSAMKNRDPVIEYRRHSRNSGSERRNNGGCVVYSPDRVVERSDKKLKVSDSDLDENKDGRSNSKLLLKLPVKNMADEEVQEEQKMSEEMNDEPVPKTWNLRPRKPLYKSLNVSGSAAKVVGSAVQDNKPQLMLRNLNKPEGELIGTQKNEKKRKFSIALSREEIEEDVFALTRSKPLRKPKKRPRAIQKLLDNLFPGLWLASITPDSYKVPENLVKI